MEEVNEYFRGLRMSDTSHLGLGDIRLTSHQQTEVVSLIKKSVPSDIVLKYKEWKRAHPNDDYQLDEINEFYSSLSRADKFDMVESLLNIFGNE